VQDDIQFPFIPFFLMQLQIRNCKHVDSFHFLGVQVTEEQLAALFINCGQVHFSGSTLAFCDNCA
jgi:hypothetical protein